MKSSSKNELQIQVIKDYQRLCDLREAWDDLLDHCQGTGLYHDIDFILSWWEGFGGDRSFRFLLVTTSTGQWVGAVPMLVESIRYRGVLLRGIKFFENGYVPSCGMLLHEDFKEQAIDKLCDYLFSFEDWNMVSLCKLPASGFIIQNIIAQARSSGLRYGTLPNIITPVIEAQGSWQDFLKSRSSSFRKQLRGKVNRFNREPGVTIKAIPVTSSNITELLNAMCLVSSLSWKKKTGTDLSGDAKAQVFINKLLSRLALRKAATVWFVHKDDQPIAFELHLHFGGVTYPLRADFDENFSVLSPGSVLEAEVIERMFEADHIKTYYSCGMDYSYLMRWTEKTLPHETLEIFPPRLLPMLGYEIEYGLMPILRLFRKR